MGLVDVVVRVLAEDYGFDCVEGCMARPVVTYSALVSVYLDWKGAKDVVGMWEWEQARTMNTHPQQAERSSSQSHAPSLKSASSPRSPYS